MSSVLSNVSVRALGRGTGKHNGSEVWLCGLDDGAGAVNLEELLQSASDEWQIKKERALNLGLSLVCEKEASLSLKTRGAAARFQLMCHPWSGLVEIRTDQHQRVFDLYSEKSKVLDIVCSSAGIVTDTEASDYELRGAGDTDIAAIAAPKWRGVYTATRSIFAHTLSVPRELELVPSSMSKAEEAETVGRILRSPVKRWVVSGGDFEFLRIVQSVRSIDPSKSFCLLFHGAFLALGMTLDRQILMSWIEAVRNGDVCGIITVKRGMDELCRALGSPSMFLPLEFPAPPSIEDEVLSASAEPKLGVWLSRGDDPRKSCPALPYALAGIENIEFSGSGINWEVASLIRKLGIKTDFLSTTPIPQKQLKSIMSRMDLNLYLTASECSPMLPLESLALGVPCLMGPVTYYFEDDQYLRDRLVVKDLSNPTSIRAQIRQALAERKDIIQAYRSYQANRQIRQLELIEHFFEENT
jgi:hypothetical protein